MPLIEFFTVTVIPNPKYIGKMKKNFFLNIPNIAYFVFSSSARDISRMNCMPLHDEVDISIDPNELKQYLELASSSLPDIVRMNGEIKSCLPAIRQLQAHIRQLLPPKHGAIRAANTLAFSHVLTLKVGPDAWIWKLYVEVLGQYDFLGLF